MRLTQIKRPITQCNKPVIKMVTTMECHDNISGDYYGTGAVIAGSEGVSPFPFQKVTNLRGFVKDVPRDIVRQNSLNCRPQKVSSSVVYQIQGGDAYPSWKMRELEEQFHGKQIIIDGESMMYQGGTMFEELGAFCNPVYRLRVNVQECTKQQIFGCQSECAPNCFYFLVPASIVTQNFYNEAGQQVASTYSGLLDWYRGQTNVRDVVDVVSALQIECDYYSVFKVTATGYIPSFLYFDSPSQANKIYGMALDCIEPNYSKLCGGIDNRSCGQLLIDPPLVFELTCGDLTLTDVEVFNTDVSCNITPFPDWEQHTGATDITSLGTTRTLNISVFNPNYIETTGGVIPDVVHTILPGEECDYTLPSPTGADILQITVNDVVLTGSDYNYDPLTNIITFTPCIEVDDEIIVKRFSASSSPVFSNELIATITGFTCLPGTTLYFNNASNPDIPLGATMTIDNVGNIKWNGPPTSADGTGSVIEVENIIYNV